MILNDYHTLQDISHDTSKALYRANSTLGRGVEELFVLVSKR